MFVWRLWHNWISLDDILQKKLGIQLASKCQCCNKEETINHVFLNGKCAKEVCNHFCLRMGFPFMSCSHPRSIFMMWISNRHVRPGSLFAVVPLLIFWFLWNGRNKSKYNEGGVTRNHLGKVAWGFYEYYEACSILEAELKAVETRLRLCWQTNINKLWVEIDSKAAMLLCTQKDKGPWEVQYTLESIHQYTSKMDIQFTFTWREGNKVADWFANKGYIEKRFNLLQGNELHGIIRGLIRMDKMNMASIRMLKGGLEEGGR
ncbi:RNase H domain-containing protein [Abeliophyllum distichum]|uniref:RNase H domain-containing protein n=1 Tax=Abeliophyllum distichum TaxID=126358 RepID=A0ABD1QF33_9LAMI